MKKKLLVITGAGASSEFGMPSVSDIDNLFEKWAKEIITLKSDKNKSLYSWVKGQLNDYESDNKLIKSETLNNFENLLYTIQTLSSIDSYDHWKFLSNRLKPFIKLIEFPEINIFKQTRIANGNDFHFLQSYLIDKLLEHFRFKCKTLKKDKPNELSQLSRFLKALNSDFELGFINLNYDNVILTALPNLNTGFNKSDGEFDRSLIYNSKWNFCYHLHGSVHFDMKGGNGVEMHKILWNNDLNSQFSQNSSGRNSNYTSEGINHLNSCIIAGLDKTNQLRKEPFGQYFMQLDRLVYESDAILFIGYGFNDLHLNNVFPFNSYDKNKKRKVVIIDWASDDEDGINFRQDAWSSGVFDTIPHNGREMGNGKSSLTQPVMTYKKNKTLEKSSNPNYPIAIWYDGFMSACQNYDKIIAELK